MPRAIGWSMFTVRDRMPAHALRKKSVLRKNTTGKENRMVSHWKPVRNPASVFDPRYSGKLNIMVLPKMKPATPKRM